MSIFRKNKVPSLHKKLTLQERLYEFWLTNQGLIVLIIIIFCISILIFMIGFAAASKGINIHSISSDANRYEHLNEIVTCYGGRLL